MTRMTDVGRKRYYCTTISKQYCEVFFFILKMMATSFINVVSLGQCTISAILACMYLSCNVEGEVGVCVWGGVCVGVCVRAVEGLN